MKVYIMRGIPGAGKSTWHQNNVPFRYVCSADLAMKDPSTGEYRFDPSKLKEAHDKCLSAYVQCLVKGGWDDRSVVADNTNVRAWEIAPYYRVAEALGLEPQIVHILVKPSLAVATGTHNVPAQKVYEMSGSFDPLPPWWNVKYVLRTENGFEDC